MATEIRVPTLGESVAEATVGQWFKKPGDAVSADEPLVELETDKVTIEVPAPAAGTLSEIAVGDGETVEVGALLGMLAEGEGAPAAKPAGKKEEKKAEAPKQDAKAEESSGGSKGDIASPAAAKIAADNKVDASSVPGSGKDGRVTKGDVLDGYKITSIEVDGADAVVTLDDNGVPRKIRLQGPTQ